MRVDGPEVIQKNHLSAYNRSVQATIKGRKVIFMANKTNSLAHTKWMCKYHIVFTPKYRRKAIRHFWAEGYYVSTVGLNESTIRKYIQEQDKKDIALDKLSVKEYADPFKK